MGLPRIDDATGAVDGANRIFYVPNPYVSGTLVAMLNGRQLDGDLDNGWIERDPATGKFELRRPPSASQGSPDDPGDLVSAYYENALEPAGGGLEGGVPSICSGRDVRPKICEATEGGLEGGVPSICSGRDIRPRICEAKVIEPCVEVED